MNNVCDFGAFKAKKEIDKDMSRGRISLSKSHGDEDFSARMARIRASIFKIDALMADLKKGDS